MTSKDLVLNIAVNLGRLGRFACEGRTNRLNQFLEETQQFIQELELMPKSIRLNKTLVSFFRDFQQLKTQPLKDAQWAEMMFTWANILTHRASL